MPTNQSTSTKKHETDHRQLLLDMIAKNYGSKAAMAMDNSFKEEKKQIKEFHEMGGTSDDFAKSIGVDLNGAVTQSLPQINQKPASSPFGFGGMSTQGNQLVEQNPGLLGGLLSLMVTGNTRTGARMDLKKLTEASKLQGGGEDNLEREKFELSKKRFKLEEGMEERRVGAEQRKLLEDTKNTIYNSGAELTDEDLQNPDIAKIVMPLIKQNRIEPIIDPETGLTIYSIPPKGIIEKTRKEVAGINLKKKELSKELSDYFAVGDSLPTSEGLGRFEQGAKLYAGSVFQSDRQGALAAQLAGLNKRLRVKLVRAAGDVGNLNIVEQEAAERLLYNFSDSTTLRGLKRAFLMDLTKAVDDDSPQKIKTIISNWSKKEQQGQGQNEFSNMTDDELKAIIGGK